MEKRGNGESNIGMYGPWDVKSVGPRGDLHLPSSTLIISLLFLLPQPRTILPYLANNINQSSPPWQ